jgi:hypothetical protein
MIAQTRQMIINDDLAPSSRFRGSSADVGVKREEAVFDCSSQPEQLLQHDNRNYVSARRRRCRSKAHQLADQKFRDRSMSMASRT